MDHIGWSLEEIVWRIHMKVVVIYGGKSAEHDISVLTAGSIIKEIYFEYYDVRACILQKEELG